MTGRSKDLILANGRNIWPQDLEWLVEHEVEGVRNGDVAAFSIDGDESETVVLLVQCRLTDEVARENLLQAVAETVRASAGVNCTVVLAPHNSLPQTSSGKLSRARARKMYLDRLRAETMTAEPAHSMQNPHHTSASAGLNGRPVRRGHRRNRLSRPLHRQHPYRRRMAGQDFGAAGPCRCTVR